jgi:hypothetical protein
MEQCCGSSVTSLREKTTPDYNRETVHITVGQTIIKESEDKKKPYTEYVVQLMVGEIKWKVSKRYK